MIEDWTLMGSTYVDGPGYSSEKEAKDVATKMAKSMYFDVRVCYSPPWQIRQTRFVT